MVLYDVQSDCGFFSPQVFDKILNGSLDASEEIPSASRMQELFSVFAFLCFCPGANIFPFPLSEGLSDLDNIQRFIAAIQ